MWHLADHIAVLFRMFLIFHLVLSSQTTKEMIARSCATIVTHPFHGKCNKYAFLDYDLNHFNTFNSNFSHKHFIPVITLRCMVQFIGREAKYRFVPLPCFSFVVSVYCAFFYLHLFLLSYFLQWRL